jgi:hypothetical protein
MNKTYTQSGENIIILDSPWVKRATLKKNEEEETTCQVYEHTQNVDTHIDKCLYEEKKNENFYLINVSSFLTSAFILFTARNTKKNI